MKVWRFGRKYGTDACKPELSSIAQYLISSLHAIEGVSGKLATDHTCVTNIYKYICLLISRRLITCTYHGREVSILRGFESSVFKFLSFCSLFRDPMIIINSYHSRTYGASIMD